jgi:hypothetical protein
VGEARNARGDGKERVLLEASLNPYAVAQMPSGRAGYYDSRLAASSGDYVEFTTAGEAGVTKASGFVAIKGNRAYWDHSAGNVTYKPVADRDFYLGRFADDATSGATECRVLLNEDPKYDRDIFDGHTTAIVGTQALGGLALLQRGKTLYGVLSSTSEAQKVDALGVDPWAAGLANAVVEMAFRVPNDGAGTNTDVSVGIASGTHATDASSIAQRLFMHLDGNSTNISFESADGTTTVAITDSTADYTEGAEATSRVEVWFDCRNPAAVLVYVNGSRVLTGTTFDVSAAASAWKLLFHLEKTSSADVYEFALDWLRAHFAE